MSTSRPRPMEPFGNYSTASRRGCRVPVVEGGQAVGIVSIGDLAVERDPDSPLAEISAASPNR